MKTISAVKARHGLGNLLNLVSLKHESYVIERSGVKMAVLSPYAPEADQAPSLPNQEAGDPERAGKLDIRDLAGIGAELWTGEDAVDYIRRERDAWD